MGEDKLLLEVGGLTLVERVYRVLQAACEEVLVVGRDSVPIAGVRFARDLRPGREGPLAGIEAGLHVAAHPVAFVAAGDMPFLSVGLVERLAGLVRGGARAAVPWWEGPHPLCAAYDRTLLPRVSCFLDSGGRAVRGFLGNLERVIYVGEDELSGIGDPSLMLMNVNTPEDLARARRVAG
ncbi:MAG: molybdenum cofactor guanylyltransferase [Rubrobacteraceae bacterium]|nr:molybdenum cofactor guanylyltransferase [Rubrobacteraceae bacterium]MCL6439034.1 molybdenum cofactor guanylyltransferase [Rubrobacteraceae bacterium]